MIYLIIANQSIISKEIDNIISKENVDVNFIFKYDLEETSFLNILETLDTINLFGGKKIVICQNLNKLDEEEKFINYLENPSNNILILTNNDKLDERKKVFKELKNYTTIIEPDLDLFNYIKHLFNNYQINPRAIRLLEEYTNDDYNRINNEIEKLKQYKSEDKIIDVKDIEEIVNKNNNDTIFNLIDALSSENKKKAFDIYNNLIKSGEDEIKILGMIANNFRLIFQTKILIKKNSEKEIINILKMHPYVIRKAIEKSYFYREDELIKIIKKIGEVDLKIKKGIAKKEILVPILLSEF